LYGKTLARQVAQVLDTSRPEVLEVGAGSGALAAALLVELEEEGTLPERYLILELSPDLRSRSRDTLAARVPHLLERVAWLNQLPPSFRGCVIGNEVLDAMPVHRVIRCQGDTLEGFVQRGAGSSPFMDLELPAGGSLRETVEPLLLPDDDYRTEVQPVACAFIRSIASMLDSGVALFVDYGFPWREYYHPQRNRGTLMCHYRHHAHADPYYLPGLQDITSHIDFSAVAAAATAAGLDLLGYTSQAHFLINCGLTDLLAHTPADDARAYLPRARQVDKLTSPAEMGELFKVIALGRGMPQPLLGFTRGDRRGAL
jgi:SAM-dependent MidA family methyltransferase